MTDKSDPNSTLGESVVVEVRAIREAIEAEAGHDIRKLGEQARRVSISSCIQIPERSSMGKVDPGQAALNRLSAAKKPENGITMAPN